MPTKTPVKRASTKTLKLTNSKRSKPSSTGFSLSKRLNKLPLIMFILVFAGIGSYMLFTTKAATTALLTTEAETMTLPTGTTVINDANASGTKSVKFSANASATSSISLPSPTSSVTVRVRGDQCKGSPSFSLSIDGTAVGTKSVTSNTYADASFTKSLTAGSHTIAITSTNYGTWKNCARNLYVDKISFIGESTVTPPPTSSSQIYWGAWMDGNNTYDYHYPGQRPGGSYNATFHWADAPWDYETWNKFEANAGKKVSILHYFQSEAPMELAFPAGTLSRITDRGAIPMLSQATKTYSLAEIAAGKYDAQLTTWAQGAKSWGKPLLYRFNWEQNGTWFNWGAQAKANPADYVNSWKRFHDIVVQQGATNVTWVWCPNIVYSGTTPLSSLYPGDAYVDWTCMDGYNKSVTNYWTPFNQLFQATYNEILGIAPNKPVMIAETASREVAGSKANWITDTLTTQLPTNFPKIKALVWFNHRFYEDGGYQPYEIESSAASQAAFAQGIASPYYSAGGSYGNLPLLTKVQPLP